MTDQDRGDPSADERLNRIIAEYLSAVEAGQTPDRQELLDGHLDLADELRAYFADYDKTKELTPPAEPAAQAKEETVGSEAQTLPPGKLVSEEPTIPAGPQALEAPTIPPTGASMDTTQTEMLPPSDTDTSDAASGQAAPSVGTKVRYFGDYELLEEIARGGMGVVYKARQISLNRIVALKMILAGQLASEEDVKRFHTEAEAAANLDHPGIVPIYEVGQHEDQHYFSMGYVEGESLAARIVDGPLNAGEAAELVKAVAEAAQAEIWWPNPYGVA